MSLGSRLDRGLIALCLIAAATLAAGGCDHDRSADRARAASEQRAVQAPRPPQRVPLHGDVRRARGFAAGRGDAVSFAAIDSRGRTYGFRDALDYQSASITKSMLLADYLDQAGEGELDAAAQDQLRAMITYSDNDAADAVYSTVGDAGLERVAERVGMRDFDPAGYWSEAWISARDMARFMWRLEHRSLVRAHRDFALELLAGITPEQRWGIPAAAGDAWSVWFKGGWRPAPAGALVHQAALLRDGRRRLAIAVLTDAQPSHEYGTETVRGIAQRLLGVGRPPATTRAWALGHARLGP